MNKKYKYNQRIISELAGTTAGRQKHFPFGKRKQTAEVEGINADNEGKEIENAEKVLKYYRAMVEDLGAKLITAIKELDEAKQVIKELEDKVELLTDELKKYKQLNRKKEE